MKIIKIISVLVIFNSAAIAQLKGTTPVGRLIPLKKNIIVDKTLPVIALSSPKVNNGDTIVVNQNYITLSGKVTDESDSVNLFINSSITKLSNGNKFNERIDLPKVVNQFDLIAFDKYKNYSGFHFTVLYNSAEPKITLMDPVIKNGNELSVNERMLTIRGSIKSDNGIDKILINNKKAEILSNEDFYFNYELAYGKNNINITAFDKLGNVTDKNIIIDWSPDLSGPIIKITNPAVSRGIKVVSKTDVVLVSGQAIDQSGILDVTINDRETSLKSDGKFSLNVYLHEGDNPLVVKAVDKKYNVSVDTFYVTRRLKSIITAGRYVALVIGINSYQGYWPPLKNAVNDAVGVANELRKDYVMDTVITILDKQATRDNIIHELEKLTNTLTSNDNLLIYYSGHGQFKKKLNKGYWVPVNATSNSTADFISNGEVRTFLAGIPAKHTLLITDACFAGDIFRGKPAESIPFDPNNMEKYYRQVYNKSSRIAITSGGLEEVEDAGKDGHSIFTYYLLKSLRENKNRFMDSSQLFNDFRIAVTNNSEQTPLMQVVRDTGDEGGQFIFVRK